MTRKTHIVVVDDDPDVRDSLDEYLALHGHDVSTADGGAALRRILAERPVDLVIVDLRMPGEDGLSITRQLRALSDVGIIILTGVGDPIDQVVGLEIGADDYIVKPFDPRELLARIKSVLRRSAGEPAPEEVAFGDTVRFGRCRLDLKTGRLSDEGGANVPLTEMEADLLATFASRPNQVLTRDDLLSLAHNRQSEPFDRSIDVRITRLRRKIEIDPSKPQTLRTVRGAGYIFVPQERF